MYVSISIRTYQQNHQVARLSHPKKRNRINDLILVERFFFWFPGHLFGDAVKPKQAPPEVWWAFQRLSDVVGVCHGEGPFGMTTGDKPQGFYF